VDDFFFELGRKLGARLRGFLLFWISLTGSESDSLQAEFQAGCDRARAFDRAARFDDDPQRLELLARITRRLTNRLSNKQRRWRVALIQADEPGAFAMPGGFIYVTRPLLELCRLDEDEIACVVGHEMGHVVNGDAVRRTTNQILVSAAARAAPIPGGFVSRQILKTGMKLLESAYSRDQEFAADEFGARLAAAGGYDPRGAIRTFERMQHLEADTCLPLASYFASHPPFAERAAKLRRLIRVRK
jgi:Zn-dependent protease with chaperone function